jgi:hypothetical protein
MAERMLLQRLCERFLSAPALNGNAPPNLENSSGKTSQGRRASSDRNQFDR